MIMPRWKPWGKISIYENPSIFHTSIKEFEHTSETVQHILRATEFASWGGLECTARSYCVLVVDSDRLSSMVATELLLREIVKSA